MKEAYLRALTALINEEIELRSGKYFSRATKEEIRDLDGYIISVADARGLFLKGDDMNNIRLHLRPSDNDWYDLKVVAEARTLGSLPKDTALCFPLDPKQLLIVNRLLFHPEDEVIFITTGIGGSGKSTFLNLIKALFDNDFSSASLSDLGNPFVVAEAVKHRLICSDELAKGELDCKVLKVLASKQYLDINPKHQTPYRVRTQSALFFCCNKAPKVDVTDTGILRRIVYYERNTRIRNPDPALSRRTYSPDELLSVARVALAFEDPDWRNVFMDETHEYLRKTNNIWIATSGNMNMNYRDYVSHSLEKGMRNLYSESTFDEIRDVFREWKKEEEASLPF